MAKKKAATGTSSGERGSKATIIKEMIAAGKSNKEIQAEAAKRGRFSHQVGYGPDQESQKTPRFDVE